MANETRPVIRIKKKPVDIFFETTALVIVGFMWCYSFYHFQHLPETIPTHFGFDGKPDDFGSKSTLWLIPGIVTALLILLRWLSKFPHKFNYMVSITAENAEKQYLMATRLMRYLQFILSCLFCYILFMIVKSAYSKTSGVDIWFILILMSTVFVPSVYLAFSSATNKSKKKTS